MTIVILEGGIITVSMIEEEILKKIELKKKYNEKIRPQIITKFNEVINQIKIILERFDISQDGPFIDSITKKGWQVCLTVIKGKLFVKYKKRDNEKITPIDEANIRELVNLAKTLDEFSNRILPLIYETMAKKLDEEIQRMEKFIEECGEAYKQYESFLNTITKIIGEEGCGGSRGEGGGHQGNQGQDQGGDQY